MNVDLEEESGLTLPADETHHLRKVLRAKNGDVFEVVDAGRNLFLAELREAGEAAILQKLQEAGQELFEVTLHQAVPKGKHMDLVVEKATEIGVGNIVPLVTEHSVVRPGGDGKLERWRRLALSAARQSLQLRVPRVGEPLAFIRGCARSRRGEDTVAQ